MKASVSGGLATHYASDSQTTAFCWKVTQRGGDIYGFTQHDEPLTFGGVTYEPTSTFAASAQGSRADMGVDTLETRGLLDPAGIENEATEAGDWDGAAFVLYRVNWANLADGAEIMRTGNVGTIRAEGRGYIAELRGMLHALRTNIVPILSPLCSADLGDTRCGVDIEALAQNGTITAVASRREFTAAALPGAAGFYTWGEVRFTSGPCDGAAMDVKSSATGGVITLQLPMGRAFGIGETFRIYPGCDKRHLVVRDAAGAVTGVEGDCKNKFNNVLRFRGHPDVAGEDSAQRINSQ